MEIKGTKKVTIGDIAEQLGVSKTTVSRALSGKGRIGEATRQKVLKCIEEQQYRPNAIAKGLAQSKTYNIGMVIPDDYDLIDMPFFQKIIMGVCEYASSLDYDVLMIMVSSDNYSQLERVINHNKVDGVILTRTQVKDWAADFLKERHIPFATVGTSEDSNVVQVDNDHVGACRELTSILINQGFQHLALLGGNTNHVVTRKRMQGFEAALEAAGMHIEKELIWLDMKRNLTMEHVLYEIQKHKADCILCMDDAICKILLEELAKRKIRVPEDICIASFYNSSLLERNNPSITSLQFDAIELGITTCNVLVNYIEGRDFERRTILGYEIAMKESTKRTEQMQKEALRQ